MIADLLTIKTPNEVAVESADPPANIDKIPLYSDFFTKPELYQRIHVHLVGVRPTDPADSYAGVYAGGLFGSYYNVSPSATVETYGPNTGSTDYFDVGKHTFLAKCNNKIPHWDRRGFCIFRKGSENTEGIKIAIVNGEDELFHCKLPSSDFPAVGEDWKEFVYAPADTATVQGAELVYKIRITDCKDQISGKDALAKFLVSTKDLSYSEEVVEATFKMDNAVVQCWRHTKKPASKAVLWFLGRNDCFMHPHVAKTLFTDKGYDLYVLNYSSNGMCRKRGWLAGEIDSEWVDNAFLNAHNRAGDFDLYFDQIEAAMKIMKSYKDYGKIIGYAHSTGGPVLINYLMKKGDDFFDGFIFNSPFLDWSADAVGSQMGEFIIEHLGIATSMAPLLSYFNLAMGNDSCLGVTATPEELKDKPLTYLGQEIVLSSWSAKLYSQFYFDFRCRPLYAVPMTPGFAKGVTKVQTELLKLNAENKHVTQKPFMCITSRSDDTLTASETLERIDYVGTNRIEIELHYNAHDVFLSDDADDVVMALELTKSWMNTQGFE